MKNIHARVMVIVHYTSSECALQMYEVSLLYLWQLSSYRADTIVIQTDPGTGIRGKNIHARVMVIVHDTLSECALQMYEVCWNISTSYQVIEGNEIANYQKENNSKNIQSRVMVPVHDTSSECALQMYEVSLKYL